VCSCGMCCEERREGPVSASSHWYIRVWVVSGLGQGELGLNSRVRVSSEFSSRSVQNGVRTWALYLHPIVASPEQLNEGLTMHLASHTTQLAPET
jgi:hypothetical protein